MKQQVSKLSAGTGSFINHLMANNATVPVVGAGATELLYSDRHAYEVIEVSADGKTVVIEACNAIRTDSNGMSDQQDYRYEPNGQKTTLVWRNGAWRRQCVQVFFTETAEALTYQERQQFFDENNQLKLVPGMTYEKKSYPKMSIIFGVQQAYHDYSF